MRPDIARCLTSRSLQLIVHPTERCNFRCTYCYERFDIGRMAPNVSRAVRRLIASRTDLDRLHVSWFGGEPLVAMPVIREIGHAAQEHAAFHGIAFGADMTTNGYRLNLATLKELLDLGVQTFQISLDGDEEAHDLTRVQANGNGSFARIWENVAAALATPWSFEIMLRIHYHADNLASVERLTDRLCASFGGDPRVVLYFKNVSPLGSKNDASFPFVEREKRAAVVEGLRERVAGRLTVEVPKEGYICYACKPGSLVIRADGSISKCTVALYDDHNRVGRLADDGTVQIDDERMRPWLDALISGSDADRACPVGRVAQGAQAAEA